MQLDWKQPAKKRGILRRSGSDFLGPLLINDPQNWKVTLGDSVRERVKWVLKRLTGRMTSLSQKEAAVGS